MGNCGYVITVPKYLCSFMFFRFSFLSFFHRCLSVLFSWLVHSFVISFPLPFIYIWAGIIIIIHRFIYNHAHLQRKIAFAHCTQAVGNFLGETFAMCDTLRLAFFSRCDLWNTGVVSALLQACHGLEWPGALGIEVLVDHLAEIQILKMPCSKKK